MEEPQWLGGEAQVYPYLERTKPAWLTPLISRGILLLAGLGIGSLGAVTVLKHEDGKQRDSIGDVVAHTSSERSGFVEQGQMDERQGYDEKVDVMGVGTILAAFGLGLVAGAVATMLTTPESGASVRNRLKRGIETARKELDEVVGEAKGDWDTVGGDVREAVKRTASRVKEAAEVTKDAVVKNQTTDRSRP